MQRLEELQVNEHDTPTIPFAPVQRAESVKPVGYGSVIAVLALAILVVAGMAFAALVAATTKPQVAQPAPSTVTETVTTGAPAPVVPTRGRAAQEVGMTSSASESVKLPSMADESSSPSSTESTTPSESSSAPASPSTPSSTTPPVATQEEKRLVPDAPASPTTVASEPASQP